VEAAPEEDVLVLDDSMIVPEDELERVAAEAKAAADVTDFEARAPEPPTHDAEPAIRDDVVAPPQAEPPEPEMEAATIPVQVDPRDPPAPTPELMAPEAAAAAAFSVGNLVRTLASSRNTQVYGGGPTLEDMVRAELRPLLKEWLDTNLPPMVERLVRVEIERVVGRTVP
jgi:cell pole-organizing protein PopZ